MIDVPTAIPDNSDLRIAAVNSNRLMGLQRDLAQLARIPSARIFRPCRSVLMSARVGRRPWQLTFERRTAPFIEPLMGYAGGTDTLTQLQFPTLEAAIKYAQRQGLNFVVQQDASERCKGTMMTSKQVAGLQQGLGRNQARPSIPKCFEAPPAETKDPLSLTALAS
jgi:hypothetical protein